MRGWLLHSERTSRPRPQELVQSHPVASQPLPHHTLACRAGCPWPLGLAWQAVLPEWGIPHVLAKLGGPRAQKIPEGQLPPFLHHLLGVCWTRQVQVRAGESWATPAPRGPCPGACLLQRRVKESPPTPPRGQLPQQCKGHVALQAPAKRRVIFFQNYGCPFC